MAEVVGMSLARLDPLVGVTTGDGECGSELTGGGADGRTGVAPMGGDSRSAEEEVGGVVTPPGVPRITAAAALGAEKLLKGTSGVWNIPGRRKEVEKVYSDS